MLLEVHEGIFGEKPNSDQNIRNKKGRPFHFITARTRNRLANRLLDFSAINRERNSHGSSRKVLNT